MKIFDYKLTDNEQIGSYIEGLAPENLVLNDYFYFSNDSFAESQNIYSDVQVGRILALTDREYFDLIKKYFSQDESNKVDEEKVKIKNQIDEINLKISESKKSEESSKKITELETTLASLEKDLKSYDELSDRIKTSSMDLEDYKHLSKFNLQKIHDDLVNINRQIDQYEEDLISKKIGEIKETKSEYEYESGKVGLASGISIGLGIFGAVFYIISTPFWISLSIWGLAIIVFIFIIVFSRAPKRYVESTVENFTTNDIDQILINLKMQRDAILKFIGVRSSNDFFLMKAKFSAAKKNFEFMSTQQKDLSEKLDLEKIKIQRAKFRGELEEIRKNAMGEIISSEKYLELYRELDSLKLKLGTDSNSIIPKEDIPKRLAEIRKELSDKLPSYAGVLKSTFERSFDKVLAKAQKFIPAIVFTNTLTEWKIFTNFQRFILLLSLAQEVYVQNFSFILEEISNWNEEDIKSLKEFIAVNNDQEFDLYILDQKKVL